MHHFTFYDFQKLADIVPMKMKIAILIVPYSMMVPNKWKLCIIFLSLSGMNQPSVIPGFIKATS